ncbi:MAG: phosphoglycerate mutase family protein [bacterium]|nr:phosphoglycerate mutase family protein [bacterium]
MVDSERRPQTIVFVRHGQSKANVVLQAEKEGDLSGYTPEYRGLANADMELTETGIQQALAAGAWIRAHINEGYFDGYYVSSFRRAQQTAGYLQLPEPENEAIWNIRDYLREQSWGYFDSLPRHERDELFPQIAEQRQRDRLHLAPLGGESTFDLVFRTKIGIIQTLYRELVDGRGIAVSHGNLLWAARIVMEGLTAAMYEELDNIDNPLDKMQNCQILQYTRVDPHNPQHVARNFSWMRSVCPWDTSLSRNEWQEIKRPKFTNAQLLEGV